MKIRPVLGAVLAVVLLLTPSGGPALAGDAPLVRHAYSFSPAFTLGGPDAGEDAFFYEKYGPVEVSADAKGHIHVLDNGNVRVQVFSPAGELLRSHGAEGDGPGEFRIPSRLAVNGAGDFAVFDLGAARISVFAADGTLLRDQIVTGSVEDLVLRDDRTLLVGYGKYGPAKVEAFAADGTLAWSAGQGQKPGGRMINIDIGVQTIAPRLAVLGGGACLRVPQGEYEVQAFSAAGGDDGTWTRPFVRREFTAEELAPPSEDDGGDDGVEVIMIRRDGPGDDHGGGAGGGLADTKTWTSSEDGETMTFDPSSLKDFMPTHHSATRGVLAFADGRIWVLTSELDGKDQIVDEWRNGEWKRRFPMPAEYSRLALGRDGNVYAVTHDEDDYPFVHRLAVRDEA